MNTFSIDICFVFFQAGSLAKKGLHEMEAIIGHCESMGCKSQVSTEETQLVFTMKFPVQY